MTNTIIQFKRLLKFSGIFNIVGAFMFIIPHAYEAYLSFFNQLNTLIGLGGKNISIPTDIFHTLFINTAGIDLVLIGSIILLVSRNPLDRVNRSIILANGIGRSIFAVIITYYAINNGLIQILVVIGAIDFFITVGFIYYLYKTRNVTNKDVSCSTLTSSNLD